MIMTDTRAAMDGMVTKRDSTLIMHRITGIITGVITQVITHIIIPNSNHAGHALRKNSTITTTITLGGTSGKKKSRVSKPGSCINTSAFSKKTALLIGSGVCGDSTA